MQLDELNMYLASDDSASDEDGVDNSDDESTKWGIQTEADKRGEVGYSTARRQI